MQKLYIKNMVCNRCIIVVQNELDKAGLKATSVQLGEVELAETPTEEQTNHFAKAIQTLGFEIIDDKKNRLIEQVKNTVIQLVHQQNNHSKVNFSDILSSKINYDYNYISNLFSEIEGTTIEKYYIAQKIERVKELLIYNELSLSEIADHLQYSSVAYLSNQFKKITGLSPSQFKQKRDEKRKPLDKV